VIWVSRVPETREELIADVNFAADVVECQNAGLDEIKVKTATLAANVDALTAKISTSGLDDKTKTDLSGQLQAFADQLRSISSDTGELDIPFKQQTSLELPKYAFSIIGQAEAAPKKKPVRPQRQPKTWVEMAGGKLWLGILAGIAFAIPSFIILGVTKDGRKIATCDKILCMVLSFYLGLAGGVALPNI